MAQPPYFPGGKDAATHGRSAAGADDVARLQNQIQQFCDRHDGDAGYEAACTKLREASAALSHMGGKRDVGATPGRKAAVEVQRGPVAA